MKEHTTAQEYNNRQTRIWKIANMIFIGSIDGDQKGKGRLGHKHLSWIYSEGRTEDGYDIT